MSKQFSHSAVFYLLEAVLILIVLAFTLKLWNYDLSVPINYFGDTLQVAMQVKSILVNGWAFDIPQLSAPFGLDAAAFPVNITVDWLMMKFLGLFSSEVGFVLNVFWLFTFVLTAWSATFCLRILGLAPTLAFIGGVLYACAPLPWFRNLAHLPFLYYNVPLLCVFAIYLAHGLYGSYTQKDFLRIGLLGVILQGFSYMYISFFAVLVFVASAALGYFRRRDPSLLRAACIVVGTLVLATAVNLSPSLYSWHYHGKPPDMNYKYAAEAEIYGLKIRKMLAPHPNNPIPILAAWGKKDAAAAFPNENENISARLGLVGALGFLFLLGVSLRLLKEANPRRELIEVIATLNLFVLLVTTVGGIGAILNLLTVPDIRAYNRFSVFILFFSLAGLGVWITHTLATLRNLRHKKYIYIAVAVVVTLSLYDQVLEARSLGIVSRQGEDRSSALAERQIVKRIEAYFAGAAKLYQLPLTGYPPAEILHHMFSYDHARPFLWATSLSFSWPSFSQIHRAWQDHMQGLQGKDLVQALVLSGFDGVWVDRFAYVDNANQVVQDLVSGGGRELDEIGNQRYVVFDLRPAKVELESTLGSEGFTRRAKAVLNPIGVSWKNGFYGIERNVEGIAFRWSKQKSQLALRNSAAFPREVQLWFTLQSGNEGSVYMSVDGQELPLLSSSLTVRHEVNLHFNPGETKEINLFTRDIRRLDAPKDPRELYFAVMNFKMIDTPEEIK
jgi:phosphoglycerol transferase